MAVVRLWVSYLVQNMVLEAVGFVIGWWVECEWYFTVMTAMMNVKVAGSLFPCVESYQLVLWSTVYNSKNWPPLTGKVTRTGCYRSMTKTGVVQSAK